MDNLKTDRVVPTVPLTKPSLSGTEIENKGTYSRGKEKLSCKEKLGCKEKFSCTCAGRVCMECGARGKAKGFVILTGQKSRFLPFLTPGLCSLKESVEEDSNVRTGPT